MPRTKTRPKTPATPRNIHATWARTKWCFRARLTVEGKRLEGPLRRVLHEAVDDRDRMLVQLNAAGGSTRLLTLEDGMKLVLEDLATRHAPPDTVHYYKWHFKILWKEFGTTTYLHDFSRETVEAFVRRRIEKDHVSPNSVNKHIQALQRILNLAVKRGHLPRNPIEHISRPRNRTLESHWLTQPEVRQLLADVLASKHPEAQRNHDIMALFYLTGLRITEAGRVQASHVDLTNDLIQVLRGKTGYREIPISTDLRTILFRLLANKNPEDALIPPKNTIQSMLGRWRRRRKDPRLNARSFRHAFGSRLAQAGRTAHQIARLMGNSIRQAHRYLHASGPQLKEAISAVSLTDAVPAKEKPARPRRRGAS